MKRTVTIFILLSGFAIANSQELSNIEMLFTKSLSDSKPDSVLYYAEEAAAIARGTIGEGKFGYAIFLRNLAVANYTLGRYNRAKYYIKQEISLREKFRKTSDQGYIEALLNGSVICRKSGDYDMALAYVKEAEKAGSVLFKGNSIEFAEILICYAGVYHDIGCSISEMASLREGAKYLESAATIYRSAGKEGEDELIRIKINLAAYNSNIGNTPQAEVLMAEALELARSTYGEKGAGYASVLNNLGVLFYNSGLYRYAEKYLVQAVAIYKELRVRDLPSEAICINNLGAYYFSIGNYDLSATLIKEAEGIFKNIELNQSPLYSVFMNNLAGVYISQEYYSPPAEKSKKRLSEAGSLASGADSLFSLNCQKPHPYFLSIRTNHAIWYNLAGNTEKSMEMLNDMALESGMGLRVVALMTKMDFSSSVYLSGILSADPEPAVICISADLIDQVSASNAKKSANAVESDPLTTALLRMVLGRASNLKKAVGIYHPAYAQILKSLIVGYSSADDAKMEEELTLEYLNVLKQKILRDFSFLSESEKELYYETRLPDIHAFTSYFLTRKRLNPSITGYAYDNVLLFKGLMLKSSTAMRVAILNSKNDELLRKYDRWITLQREISALYSTPVEFRKNDVVSLEQEANSLERTLVESSQEFSDYRNGLQVKWEDVRNSLKPGEAAIEFTDFRKNERDGGNISVYCALVLKHDSQWPVMIRLFEEDQLSSIIDFKKLDNISGINSVYGTLAAKTTDLYNLIWKPIESELSGIKTVFISPSGLLNKVSFAAISNGRGVYLCDNYNFEVKGSTGSIRRIDNTDVLTETTALVFGGINYSSEKGGSDIWGYLEGTKEEGDQVKSILGNGNISVSYLSGNSASETFFKEKAGDFNILHLATHGFFFSDPLLPRIEEKSNVVEYGDVEFRGASRSYGVNSFVNNENPLMRSGIVLAGANDVWVQTEQKGADDGVLTAQEVTQLDLRKNELVVLSACETGLGDIKGTEGVYGLQRALKIAGVKNLIISLWEIPDRETVEFMKIFYTSFLESRNIHMAFSEAQRRMRTKYDPYYWASFVLLN